MKHYAWILVPVFAVSLISFPKSLFAKVYANPGQEAAMESRMDQQVAQSSISQDSDRNQELLAIWKDHVKNLTRERDEAYQEIQALKNQGAVLRQAPGAQNTMSDSEREAADRTISDLRTKLQALQSETDQLKSAQPRDVASVDQDLKTELGNLRAENRKLKMAINERTETQSDKEVILREKEEALSRLDFLKDKMTLLQKKYEQLQSETQKNQDTSGGSVDSKEYDHQMKMLQAKAEKLKVVENEFQEARDYFASYMKELDAKNKQLTDENSSLRTKNKELISKAKSSLDALETN